MRKTVTVRPRGETQMLVRSNVQYKEQAVEEPKLYQDFFIAGEIDVPDGAAGRLGDHQSPSSSRHNPLAPQTKCAAGHGGPNPRNMNHSEYESRKAFEQALMDAERALAERDLSGAAHGIGRARGFGQCRRHHTSAATLGCCASLFAVGDLASRKTRRSLATRRTTNARVCFLPWNPGVWSCSSPSVRPTLWQLSVCEGTAMFDVMYLDVSRAAKQLGATAASLSPIRRLLLIALWAALALTTSASGADESTAAPGQMNGAGSGDRPTQAQADLMQGVADRRYQVAIEKADSEHQAAMKKCEGLVWAEERACKDQVSTETAQSQAKAQKDREERVPPQ